jgi:uncharacterized protein (TIGR02147 family)
MPDIFKYTDFRKYLKDAIEELRKSGLDLPYRRLAQIVGLKAPSHVLLVMQGKKSLTNSLSLRLTRFLKLTRKQTYYFEHMANFNQSSTKLERDEYYGRMASLNPKLKGGKKLKK